MEAGLGADERGVGRPGGDQGIEDRGEWEEWGGDCDARGDREGTGGLEGRRGEWEDGRGDREDVRDSTRRRGTAWGPREATVRLVGTARGVVGRGRRLRGLWDGKGSWRTEGARDDRTGRQGRTKGT